jgi:hypothetical protein
VFAFGVLGADRHPLYIVQRTSHRLFAPRALVPSCWHIADRARGGRCLLVEGGKE